MNYNKKRMIVALHLTVSSVMLLSGFTSPGTKMNTAGDLRYAGGEIAVQIGDSVVDGTISMIKGTKQVSQSVQTAGDVWKTEAVRIEEMIRAEEERAAEEARIAEEQAAQAAALEATQLESTNVFMQLAKGLGISIFIVGHVTKEGTVAGPRVLEHMVDTVLYFEGDRHASYRILRAVKNRFGSTNEIGVFEMRQDGLKEVENPSEYMLEGRPENASGSVVACSMEGTRPILIEIQALVCPTNFGMPRRTAAGTDYNRVNLLMAVLEKRIGFPLSNHDAYVNIAGGIKMNEPAVDLGIVLAIVSSYKNRPLAGL